MKHDTAAGSRIAIVHNGSALFTGDAGQGESNVRRWIIENDWLEAIIGLPLDMFYNTGIATYIWVLSNRKSTKRKGKIQLIDATEMHRKLRKNLGKKNCEFAPEHVQRIIDLFLRFEQTPESKIFDAAELGYHKIIVERPLRLRFQITSERERLIREDGDERTIGILNGMKELFGDVPEMDFNAVKHRFEQWLDEHELKARGPELKRLWTSLTSRDERAEPVIRRRFKDRVEYEPDADLRDTENVPMTEGIEDFFNREVLPYLSDASVDHDKTSRGYEISFTKHFYKYPQLRSLQEIASDIFALEEETKGLLHQIVVDVVDAK